MSLPGCKMLEDRKWRDLWHAAREAPPEWYRYAECRKCLGKGWLYESWFFKHIPELIKTEPMCQPCHGTGNRYWQLELQLNATITRRWLDQQPKPTQEQP